MRVVIQRCSNSNVVIDDKIYNKIEKGLFLLVGFTDSDTEEDLDYCVRKVVNLRIFDDDNGIMNKSVIDVGGSILCISLGIKVFPHPIISVLVLVSINALQLYRLS